MSNVYAARARVAGLKRHRPADDPVVVEAVADLKTAVGVEYARELAESWPPLSAEQRSRIAAALLPASDLPEAC